MSTNINLKNSTDTTFSITHSDGANTKVLDSKDIAVAIDTVADFPANPNNGDVVIVRDLNRGGTFIYDSSEVAGSNDGTNFDGWIRQYSGAVNVKWFGAVGDGIVDDTVAIQSAINSADSIFIASGNYIVENLTINNKSISGVSAIITVKGTIVSEFGILFSGTSYMQGIDFVLDKSSLRGTLIKVYNTQNSVFDNCTFSSDPTSISSPTTFDCYNGNNNLMVLNCTFNQYSAAASGGVWIREFYAGQTSKNFIFDNCIFNKKGGDELVAIWGWNGTIDGVIMSNCLFNGYSSSYNPLWFFTLGQSGTSRNIKIINSKFYIEYVTSGVFKSYSIGGGDNILIDGCDFNIIGASANSYFIRNASGFSAFVFTNNNLVVGALALLQYGIQNVRDVVRNTITVNYCSDNIFHSCTNIVGNTIVINSHSKVAGPSGVNLLDNNITLNNTSSYIAFQQQNVGDLRMLNNTITATIQCTQLIFTSGVSGTVNHFIKGNTIVNGGIYSNHASGITLLTENNLINFAAGAMSSSQIYNNIRDGVFKPTGL